jgi:hypothetical protein
MYAKTLAAITLAISLPLLAADGTATGTVAYKGKTVTIKHVWLVRGPDAVDPKLTIRELIFSPADIGAKVKACKKMSCLAADLDDGLTVDLDAGPRLNYWIVLNGQRIQYSGTAKPETLKATANTPERVAGKLTIDDSKAGGGKIEIDFDTPLTAELKAAR